MRAQRAVGDDEVPLFVLVGGPPASGKTTLARALAPELGLSLLAKDAIKEALMDALGRPVDVPASQRLGRAAVLAMLEAARTSTGAVLDSTWFAYARPAVEALPGVTVEVRCVVPRALASERYGRRSGSRHAGHLDAQRGEDELWGPQHRPLGVGPLLDVDTTGAVDVARVAADVRRLARGVEPVPGPRDD